MRCVCCNKILPPVTIHRTILIAHPTLKNKTTTLRIIEDCCHSCAMKSRPMYQQEETEDLTDLGLSLPEGTNHDY